MRPKNLECIIEAKVNEIAIDYSWLGPTGIGRVATEVINRVPQGWRITGVREGRPNAAPLTPFDLWQTLRGTSASLFWSPGFMPPLANAGIPTVLTVHDLTHLHYYSSAKKAYYNALIKPLLKRASHIVTVSDFTRDELLNWSGLPEDRVTTILNAVSPSFNSSGPVIKLDRPYILYAGNRRSYKNVDRLVKAFAVSKLPEQGYVLGLTGNSSEELNRLTHESGLEKHVHYFGFVPEEELPALYRGAHALAFVSLYEGFGLPILESMASGVPVLTSNISSMPEVAGDAALLIDPHDVASIAAGLVEIAEHKEKREQLISRGFERAARYSWDKTAADYWTLFSRLRK